MRIGYPCINLSIACSSARTFRLRSYSDDRLIEIVDSNLSCLEKIMSFNEKHGIRFFRISSDLVPFASHRVCTYPWQKHFRARFAKIGKVVKTAGARISMHPDQFVLINAKDANIFNSSVRELLYHAEVMDLMALSTDAKIQIHVGGIYDDKEASIKRFVRRFERLPETVKRRLAIENDDRLYSVADCMKIHEMIGLPVIIDSFHHELKNEGEQLSEALEMAASTWSRRDGPLMVDYSSQQQGSRIGAHAETIDVADFKRFLAISRPHDFDLMLEIKDKEVSAQRAMELAAGDPRFFKRDGVN